MSLKQEHKSAAEWDWQLLNIQIPTDFQPIIKILLEGGARVPNGFSLPRLYSKVAVLPVKFDFEKVGVEGGSLVEAFGRISDLAETRRGSCGDSLR